MRIAQVIPSLAVAAGPTTFCVKVADELAKTGCDVDLYASSSAMFACGHKRQG